MATILQTKRIIDLPAVLSALGSDLLIIQRGDDTQRLTVEQLLAAAPTGPGGTVSRAIEQSEFRSAYEDEQMQLGRWSLVYERTGHPNYVLVQELGAGMIGLAYEVEPASPTNPSDRIVAVVNYDPLSDETAPISGDGTAEEGIPYFSPTDARLLNRPAGQVLRRRISSHTRRLAENIVEFTTLPVPAPTFLEDDPNWREVSPPPPVLYQSLQPLFLMRTWAASSSFTPGLRYRISFRGGGAPDVLATAATAATLEAGTAVLIGGTTPGTFNLGTDTFTPGAGASTFAALSDDPTDNAALAAALDAKQAITGWNSKIVSGTATIGTGSKSVTIGAGLLYRAGDRIRVAAIAGWVEGILTSYNVVTGVAAFTVVSGEFAGSGTLGTGALIGPGQLQGSTGVSVTDGTKGDIVVSGTGTIWTIPDGTVTTAKMGGDVSTVGKALLTATTAAAQRSALGLGSASTQASSAFAAASHTHVVADLTDATATGQALMTATSASAARSALGLGSAATQATSAFDTAGAATAAVSTHAALASGVHGITTFAATLLDDTTAAAMRTTLGLGSAATATATTAGLALLTAADTAAQKVALGLSPAFSGGVAIASTNTTAEEVLIMLTIPAGTMSAGSVLKAFAGFDLTGSTNTKSVRMRAANNATFSTSYPVLCLATTSSAASLGQYLRFEGVVGASAASLVCPNNLYTYAVAAYNAGATVHTLDFTQTVYLFLTSAKSVGTDTCTLRHYAITTGAN